MKHITHQLDDSEYSIEGYLCPNGLYQIVYPRNKRRFDDITNALFIGSAGIDGIEFAYLPGDQAIFVYYPIDKVFNKIANGFDEFINEWISGRISI